MTTRSWRWVAAASVALGGCMLGPTNDERIARTTDLVPFSGFDTEASGLVQVRAWDYTAHAFAPIGPAVRADPGGITPAGGITLYQWLAPQVVPPRFWRAGPGGGACTVLSPQTTHANGATYGMITVEENWGSCWNADPNTAHFYEHCRSSRSPLARLYTEDWGDVVVGRSASDWSGVGTLASHAVHVTFDNFDPTEHAACSAATPAGCPQGLPPDFPTDPEAYKFFRPNGGSISSVLTGAPTTIPFTINPSRSAPMTIYVDDLTSRTLDFRVAGGKLVLGINFATTAPHIRMDCFADILCLAIGRPTITFAAPRAELTFGLELVAGSVRFTDVATVFTTGNADDRSIAAGNAIASAITQRITGDASIRSALDGALDAVVRIAGRLGLPGSSLTIESLSLAGTTMTIRPGCAPL